MENSEGVELVYTREATQLIDGEALMMLCTQISKKIRISYKFNKIDTPIVKDDNNILKDKNVKDGKSLDKQEEGNEANEDEDGIRFPALALIDKQYKNYNNHLKKLIYLDIITKERGAKYDSIISKCWKFIIKIPSI